MPSDFFTQLGKTVAVELASPSGKYPNNTARREHLSNVLRDTLANHLNRPPTTAKDSAMRRMTRDQDPDDDDDGPVTLNSDDCMTLVQKCIDGLDDDEREAFLEALGNLFQSEGSAGNGSGNNSPTNGVPPNNKEALDRRRRKGGRDNNMMPPPGPMSGDRRRPGMDGAIRGLNTSNFLKRWPDAAKVAFGGTGR